MNRELLGIVFERVEASDPDVVKSIGKSFVFDIPDPASRLLVDFSGGVPDKSYFFSNEYGVEVGVGYVLVCRDKSKRVTFSDARGRVSDKSILPLFVDNGNSGYLCINGSGEVVYVTLHSKDVVAVASSITAFLEGLEVPPF